MKSRSVLAAATLCTALSAQAQESFTSPQQLVFVRGSAIPEGNSGTSSLTFRIERVPQLGTAPLTLRYSTADGTALAGSDYVAKQGSVTLSPAAPVAEVSVLVNGDTLIEPNETFSLILRNPTLPATAEPVAVGGASIIDDDAIAPPPPGATGFYVRAEAVREGNSGLTPLRFTIVRTNPLANTNLVLNFATASDSATSGVDFEAKTGQVTLTPQQPTATVTVNVIGDTLVEEMERFKLQVADPLSTTPPQVAFGVIFDDDGVPPPPPPVPLVAVPFDALAVEPATGDTEARLAVRLLRPATVPIVIAYAVKPGATATAGVDYTGPASGTLEFAVGDVLKQITFRVKADSLAEAREFVSYQFTPPATVQMPRNSATLFIVDRPVEPPPLSAPIAVIIPCRPFVKEDEGTAKLIVKRVGDTSAALVLKFKTEDGSALAGSDYTALSGDLNWVAGNAEMKRVEVAILEDAVAEPPERFKVQLTNVAGVNLPGRSSAPVVILDSLDHIFNEDFSELCTSDTDLENDPNPAE